METKQKKFIIGVLIAAVLCLGIVYFFATRVPDPYKDINIEEYVDIADYNKVQAKTAKITVTKKELNDEINKRLDAEKKVTKSETGVVENGDTVNIDYVGSIDGVKFDGGEEKGRDLKIGSHEFIPGFEEGLIGAKVGTTKNIKVTFPKDYMKSDLAGKNAIFAVKINSKDIVKLPPLDEKFVKEHSDCKTVKEYKKEVYNQVLKEKQHMFNLSSMNSMWTSYIDKCKMKKDKDGKEMYPEERLQALIDETMAFYEEVASNNNVSVEDYAKQMFGMDQKTFETQIREYAKIMIKEQMVVYYIAEKEGIEVSKDDYNNYIKETLKAFGYTEESFKEANNGKSYEEIEGKERVREAALKAKVQETLLEKGQANYEKALKEKAAKEKALKEKKAKEKALKEKKAREKAAKEKKDRENAA